jgi:hypothetical protein
MPNYPLQTSKNQFFWGSEVIVGEADGKNLDMRTALPVALTNSVKYTNWTMVSMKYEVNGADRRLRLFVNGKEIVYRDIDSAYPQGSIDNHVVSTFDPGSNSVISVEFANFTDGDLYGDTSVNNGAGIRWLHAFADNTPALPHPTDPAQAIKKDSEMQWDYMMMTTNNYAPLPPPWLTTDIGSGIAAGDANAVFGSNAVYTVNGAGNISGTADKFRFVYQTLNGDGEIRARIPAFGSGTSARIGVMMRDTLTAGSRTAFMGVNGSGSFYSLRRTTTGGSIASTASSNGTAPNVWVRLVRTGNTVVASKSSNGTSWTTVNTATVNMAANCYFGLCVASGTTNTLNSVMFDSLTVIQ